jgi:PAS domain S-box-containing protein
MLTGFKSVIARTSTQSGAAPAASGPGRAVAPGRVSRDSHLLDAFVLFFNSALVILIWFAVTEIVHTDRRETMRAAIERSDNLAIALEAYAARTIESADAIVRHLIREKIHAGANFDLQQFVEKHTIDNSTLAGIVIADEHGRVATTTLNLVSDKPVNVSDREHFRVHRERVLGRAFVGKPVVGRITGRLVVPVTRRINKPDGSFGGVAMAVIEHARLTDMLDAASLHPLDTFSILGEDGITRARLSGNRSSAGEDLGPSPLFSEIKRRPNGHFFAPGVLDGINRYFSYRSLPEFRLIAVVGMAESDMLAEFSQRRQRYLSAAAGASAVIILFTLALLLALDARRKAAAETARSQSRFLATFNQAAVGIALTDIDGRFIDVNDKFCSILGYSRAELLQRTAAQVAHPEDVEAGKRLQRRLIADPDNAGNGLVEKRHVRKDGTIVWCLCATSAVRDEHGGIECLAAVVQDISERKRDEQALHRHAEQMRELSLRLSQVEETERRNIHRELHDQIGANLSALKLDLGLILRSLQGEAGQDVRDRLLRARQLIDETIARVRNVMADLRPTALDEYGLLPALREYALPFGERLGVAVTVSGEASGPRPAAVLETALFRIAQEAINNVAKHARARAIEIRLDAVPGKLVLSIADDGAGFDAEAAMAAQGGWGLRTMRERAQAIGGELGIESAPGRGTRVSVAIAREAA